MSTTEHHETWLTEIQKGTYALLSDSDDVDAAVIFVHGFLGDPQGTWLNFQEFICASDQDSASWSSCDVFFFAYPSFHKDITESAQDLLNFISRIFPEPPDSIFHLNKHVPTLPDMSVDLSSRKPTYKVLVLVGHSEGGVVIRRSVDLAHGWEQSMPVCSNVLQARLALFAPAHRGVKLSGWIGACLAIGRVDAVAAPILRSSPAFSEMKDKELLKEIESHTSDYLKEAAAKKITVEALQAHVVYGEHEPVVVKGFYTSDCFHPSIKDKSHSSVCKPRTGYKPPIDFVMRRVKGVGKCTDLKLS